MPSKLLKGKRILAVDPLSSEPVLTCLKTSSGKLLPFLKMC